MVENITESERFRRASRDSARTVLDLGDDEVLVPYPAVPGRFTSAINVVGRSP
ncbi:hypothetical protein ACFZAB_22570 [Streptomyces albogriseolus]|uniref:hypothetical protein n=1 Tax=Streptomyces albogriseolus TaxID=1887 RepID=UPI00345FCE6C